MRVDRRPVLRQEDLAAIRVLFEDLADEYVERLGGEREPSVEFPSAADEVWQRLDAYLEHEIVEAVDNEASDGRILPHEADQEKVKKALTQLKAKRLRELARSFNLSDAGGLDELTTTIGRSMKWNEEAVAELILANEAEPSEVRSYSARVFPLDGPPPLDTVREKLGYVRNHYIRIGVARWFVFQTVSADAGAGTVQVSGTLRAWQAEAVEEAEAAAIITTDRRDRTVTIILGKDVSYLTVIGANAVEASAAVRALASVAKVVRPLGRVPLTRPAELAADSPGSDFATESLYMLDLITARLASVGLPDPNITMARFRMSRTIGDADDDDDSEASDRPQLRAVRLDGVNIFDSPPACKLLAEEGRALVDVTLSIRSAPRKDGESVVAPVRLAIEHDSFALQTGWGGAPTLARDIHLLALEAIQLQLANGIKDLDQLVVLTEGLAQRADSSEDITQANLFVTSREMAVEDD